MYKRIGLWVSLAAAAVFILWGFGLTRGQPYSTNALAPLLEVYSHIRDNFYKPGRVEHQKLVDGAIRGMIEQLDDPYSRYLTREEYAEFSQSLDRNTLEEFGGVGLRILVEDGRLLVISPLKDTPAWRAGVRAGDWIYEIDGNSTQGITAEEAARKLRGPKGTAVIVAVEHEDGVRETLQIVRDIIQIKLAESDLLLDGRVGYLRLNEFTSAARTSLDQLFAEFKRSEIQGLIIDLRSNPGGLLSAAIDVASFFIEGGETIVIAEGRRGQRVYRSEGNDLPNWPIAILVNRGTASASEIVAGAVRAHEMAILIGRRSFGKGIVQTYFPLGDGSAIALTTDEYVLPGNIRVQGTGLEPNIDVVKQEDDLKTALTWLQPRLGRFCPDVCRMPRQHAASARSSLSPPFAQLTEE